MRRKIKLLGLSSLTLTLLAACGRSEVAASSTSGWDQIVYFFAEAIQWLSTNGRIGVGVVLSTITIRAIIILLYNMQIKSRQKVQDLQPELKKLQKKYPGCDTDSRMKLTEEGQALYKECGVNPCATTLPLVVQLPILMTLCQALARVAFLKTGTFLWIKLSRPDPYFILPVLATLFTLLSSWLTNEATRKKNIAMTMMAYVMPVMIFFMSFRLASGVVLYWSVSYAFQVFQILLLNNPFRIITKRSEEE